MIDLGTKIVIVLAVNICAGSLTRLVSCTSEKGSFDKLKNYTNLQLLYIYHECTAVSPAIFFVCHHKAVNRLILWDPYRFSLAGQTVSLNYFGIIQHFPVLIINLESIRKSPLFTFKILAITHIYR